jgi:hypothetical protein
MAVPWAAIVNLGVKGVKAGIESGKRKGVGGASLVDPTQAAMVNQLQRERRGLQMGTGAGQAPARAEAAKQTKRFLRNRALMGGRNIADIADYRGRIESAITKGVAEERMGLLGPIVEQKENISKRKMDLLELEKERGLLKKEATGQNIDKNLSALAPTLMDAFKKKGGQGGDVTAPQYSGNKFADLSSAITNAQNASKNKEGGGDGIGNMISGLLSKIGQGGQGGQGGGGGFDWGGLLNTAISAFGGGGGGK